MFKPLLMSPFLVMGLSAGIVLSRPAHAVNFTFTQIAEFDPQLSFFEEGFFGLDVPAIDQNGDVAFTGYGRDFSRGVYIKPDGSSVQNIANRFSFNGWNQIFPDVAVEDGVVVFTAEDDNNLGTTGIYKRTVGGRLEVVANRNTPKPGGGNFIGAFNPSLKTGNEWHFSGIMAYTF